MSPEAMSLPAEPAGCGAHSQASGELLPVTPRQAYVDSLFAFPPSAKSPMAITSPARHPAANLTASECLKILSQVQAEHLAADDSSSPCHSPGSDSDYSTSHLATHMLPFDPSPRACRPRFGGCELSPASLPTPETAEGSKEGEPMDAEDVPDVAWNYDSCSSGDSRLSEMMDAHYGVPGETPRPVTVGDGSATGGESTPNRSGGSYHLDELAFGSNPDEPDGTTSPSFIAARAVWQNCNWFSLASSSEQRNPAETVPGSSRNDDGATAAVIRGAAASLAGWMGSALPTHGDTTSEMSSNKNDVPLFPLPVRTTTAAAAVSRAEAREPQPSVTEASEDACWDRVLAKQWPSPESSGNAMHVPPVGGGGERGAGGAWDNGGVNSVAGKKGGRLRSWLQRRRRRRRRHSTSSIVDGTRSDFGRMGMGMQATDASDSDSQYNARHYSTQRHDSQQYRSQQYGSLQYATAQSGFSSHAPYPGMGASAITAITDNTGGGRSKSSGTKYATVGGGAVGGNAAVVRPRSASNARVVGPGLDEYHTMPVAAAAAVLAAAAEEDVRAWSLADRVEPLMYYQQVQRGRVSDDAGGKGGIGLWWRGVSREGVDKGGVKEGVGPAGVGGALRVNTRVKDRLAGRRITRSPEISHKRSKSVRTSESRSSDDEGMLADLFPDPGWESEDDDSDAGPGGGARGYQTWGGRGGQPAAGGNVAGARSREAGGRTVMGMEGRRWGGEGRGGGVAKEVRTLRLSASSLTPPDGLEGSPQTCYDLVLGSSDDELLRRSAVGPTRQTWMARGGIKSGDGRYASDGGGVTPVHVQCLRTGLFTGVMRALRRRGPRMRA